MGVGFSQVTPVEITGTPSLSARIVATGNPVLPKSERTFSRNFDTGVFQAPAVGTIGNTGKTLLRGPGINNWDIGLARSFPIRERVRVQFRSEFYNGQFTAARNSRFIQFALKISF